MSNVREIPVQRWRALVVSAGLSVLFIVVYGTTNWLASRRPDVTEFLFSWERSIPFVSFFILPYLSIDLFFVSAPFICRSAAELRTFTLRISAAICVAGLCFIILPLRCAFQPASVDSWLGQIFAAFLSVDRPFNLVPSLHAALGLLLFDLYFRKTRGVFRVLISAWFLLIALSPLLTHQHQVADIVTGAALAGYCFYAFRADVPAQPDRDEVVPAPSRPFGNTREWGESLSSRKPPSWVTPNFRIALLYLGGAATLFVVVARDVKQWATLGWVAASLGLVSAAYFGAGPRIFGKRSDGTMPLSSLFVLGPCVFGQFLSLLYYRRRIFAHTRITSATFIGRRPNKREAAELIASGVTAVLDLSAELSEVPALRELNYLCVPILDLTAPTLEQLDLAARFVSSETESGQVYVHCKIGYSRSAAVIAAYLLFSRRAETVAEAIAMIKQARPGIVVSPAALKALEEFRLRLTAPSSPGAFLLASSIACGP